MPNNFNYYFMPVPRISKDYNNDLIFLTITTIEWINIFTSKEYFDLLIESLRFCQEKKDLHIYGYVIMTNHLHLLVASKKNNLADIIRDFKSFTTRKIKLLLLEDRRKYILNLIQNSCDRKKDEDFQIWQSNNYPEVLSSEKFVQQKINYIHQNPVKKGYVKLPEDWLYSSARNYFLNDDTVLKVEVCY